MVLVPTVMRFQLISNMMNLFSKVNGLSILIGTICINETLPIDFGVVGIVGRCVSRKSHLMPNYRPQDKLH